MSRTLARATGAFGLAHVVLLLAGFAIARPTVLHDSPPDELLGFYVDGSEAMIFTGGTWSASRCCCSCRSRPGCTACCATRETRHGVAAATARMAAVCYITIGLAPGMSAAAAGVYLGHRGLDDPALLAMATNLRGFSYFLSLLALAMFLVAVAVSSWPSGALPRWLSGSAAVLGIVLAAAVTRATEGWSDLVTLAVLGWLVAASVWLLARRAQAVVDEPSRQVVATSASPTCPTRWPRRAGRRCSTRWPCCRCSCSQPPCCSAGSGCSPGGAAATPACASRSAGWPQRWGSRRWPGS